MYADLSETVCRARELFRSSLSFTTDAVSVRQLDEYASASRARKFSDLAADYGKPPLDAATLANISIGGAAYGDRPHYRESFIGRMLTMKATDSYVDARPEWVKGW